MHMKVSAAATVLFVLLAGAPAHAQSAAQYNRAAQAIQLCSSPVGALAPECAQLRGALGGGMAQPIPVAPYTTGGGKAAIAAGLLGMATKAISAKSAAPAPAATDYYTATALATQNATAEYHACVARVGPSNAVGVQGCLAQLQTASGGAPAVAPQAASVAKPAAAAAINAFSAFLGR